MRAFLLCFFSVCMLGQHADAALTYGLFFRGGPFTEPSEAIVPVAPGQRFDNVGLFFREVVTDGSTSILASEVIQGYRISVSAMGSDGRFENFVTDETGGFATDQGAGVTNTIGFSQFAFNPIRFGLGKQAVETSPGSGIFEARIGTLDLIAPSVGQTTFTSFPADGFPGDIGTSGPRGTELVGFEGGAFVNASLTVTAIPEPSSVALLAGLGAFGAFRLHRKRKLAKTAAV